MSKLQELNLSVRLIVGMLLSFVLVVANISTAHAVGTTLNTINFKLVNSAGTTKPYGIAFTPSTLPNSRGNTSVPTITVDTPAICSYEPTTKVVTPLAPGTCTMTASDAGNETYAAAVSKTASVTITKLAVSVTPVPSKRTWWSGESAATFSWVAEFAPSTGQLSTTLPNGDTLVSASKRFSNYATQGSPTSTLPTTVGLYDLQGADAVFSTPGASSRYEITYKKVPVCIKDSALKTETGGLVVCLDTNLWSVVESNTLKYGWDGIDSFTWPGAVDSFTSTPWNSVEQIHNTTFVRKNDTVTAEAIGINTDPTTYAVGIATGYLTISSSQVLAGKPYAYLDCHSEVAANVPVYSAYSIVGVSGSVNSEIGLNSTSGNSSGAARVVNRLTPGTYAVESTFIKRSQASTAQPWTLKCRINGTDVSSSMFKTYAGAPATITAVSPAIGPVAGGTALTVTGTNFAAGAIVNIGGVPCRDVVVVSSTKITCNTRPLLPGFPGTNLPVTVLNTNGTSGELLNAYEYGTPKAPKAITYPVITNQPLSSGTLTTTPTVTGAGQTVTVTSETPEVCTVIGFVIHFVSGGVCTSTATSGSNATFSAATPVTRSFTIEATPDAPTISSVNVNGLIGGVAEVTFTAGNSNGANVTGYKVSAIPADGAFGFPVTVNCTTPGVACSVPGLTPGVPYTFVASTIASLSTGPVAVPSAPFGPVTPKLPQVIELPNPGGKKPVAGTTFPVFPTSDIGAIVTPDVTSLTPNICTVENNLVTLTGVSGDCSLQANQVGTSARGYNYGAAEPVSITFRVNASVPTITSTFVSNNVVAGLPIATTLANAAVKGTASIPTKSAWSATGLPAGLSIDPNTGAIKGTPTAAGVYNNITVYLTDAAKITVSKTLSLTVAAGPGIVGPSTIAVVSGKPATIDALVALPGSSAIPTTGAWAVSNGTLPAGLTLNPDTGVVSGTPTGVVGKVTVTITLTDSAPLTASKVLTFDVASAPIFGAAGGANPAATINLVGVAKVPGLKLASGSAFVAPAIIPGTAGKPAKGAYSAVPTGNSAALPDGIVFNVDTGAITGTPLVPGTYDFKVVFTDAKGLTAEQPYRFVVATPPSITNAVMLPVYTVPATGTAPLFSVDLEGEPGTTSIPGSAAWSVVTPTLLPAGLTLNPDTGVISGTPPTGLTKDYTFKIRLTDSAGLIAEKTFTLPVVKAGVNKTTLNLPAELANGTLFTDELFDLNGDNTVSPPLVAVAASSLGLTVTYSVTALSALTCFIDADNFLHIIGAGKCAVTATSGTAAAKNVSAVTQSFDISKRSQVLTVTAPGETIPDSDPSASAPEATDDPAGFKLAATLSSGLDPVYTVIPAKNPKGTDKDPNCAVDDAGNVTWLYDMTLSATSPGYDVNGDKCRVAISHAGNANYSSVVTQFLDLTVTHVTPSAPNDDDNVEPGVSMALPRTGGTAYKGGVGFTVKVTPTGVTVQPISKGLYIGPITAKIAIEYKVNNVVQSQTCTTSFGIAIRDAKKNVITNPALETKAAIAAITAPYRAMPKGGPKGYLAAKNFTNSVTCALNKEAVSFFKSGGQLKANAEVFRDRRWPTTYKAAKPNGEKIAPRTVNWVLKVG